MPSEPSNRILATMLDRIFAAIVSGPALNCRPHSSRQRVDLAALARFGDMSPSQVLASLVSDSAAAVVAARVPAPASAPTSTRQDAGKGAVSPDDEPENVRESRRAFAAQQSLLTKLRLLSEDATTYEQDTGAHVLYVGYPLLSFPSGAGPAAKGESRRVLAPIAFIPVDLSVRTQRNAGVEVSCRNDGVDRVIPNEGLLAWIERQTGKDITQAAAEVGELRPWDEVCAMTQNVCAALGLSVPEFLAKADASSSSTSSAPFSPALLPTPDTESLKEPAILPCAVIGLFPTSKQGLLRDTKAMIGGKDLEGPVERFLQASGRTTRAAVPEQPGPDSPPDHRRLVTDADPCQAHAVMLARTSDALVIHGPPGTGKSQTITNIIADHLARGQRVLFVCDKRTALDVVANRLEHLGLGSLCALVHDAQRDQRDLYRSIREQIENLAETKPPPDREHQIAESDAELARIMAELERYREGLMHIPAGADASFHQLTGQWLALSQACAAESADAGHDGAVRCTTAELNAHMVDVQAVLRHAESSGYSDNPWREACGLTLDQFLERPVEAIRSVVTAAVTAAEAADATAHASIPGFALNEPLEGQAQARERLLNLIEAAFRESPAQVRSSWAARDAGTVARAVSSLADIEAHIASVTTASFDPELLAAVRAAPMTLPQLAAGIAALDEYLAVAGAWHGFVHFGRRSRARAGIAPLGLALTPETARRARGFLAAMRSAMIVRALLDDFEGTASQGVPNLDALRASIRAHTSVTCAIHTAHSTACLTLLARDVGVLIASGEASGLLMEGLRRSPARAKAVAAMEGAASSDVFARAWFQQQSAQWRQGAIAQPLWALMRSRIPTVESVLRVRDGAATLPPSLAAVVGVQVARPVILDPALLNIRRLVTAAEIRARLEELPHIARLDAQRLQTLFARWEELDSVKHRLVRDSALRTWTSRQRSRLLAATGTRLNSDGAELRRRVSSRGAHALRLRQVLERGRSFEDGDPMLDLRPVWMASPETVAQVFPRDAVFDIVVFDEASQCRLEEAIPVLTRARRVVIAGDPKQLPPTRFFEDTAAVTTDVEAAETDQDLFETQQSEVEDLLGAALNLDLHQAYLDVHYRSRNADLIEFSNAQFYGSRLQPIPGHPANRTRYAPLTLYNVAGVYDKRTNAAEADQVVRIIRDLLRRADPPSIGVGCFNIAQRDLIVERLDAAAADDPVFAAALGAARARRGHGSFEGLFVKNLENVQGDERDHIIISTTYGPNPEGRFYRRFGPLGMPGGGRRLNVLVTRARNEVHLVTSIPAAEYRSLPPVEPGQSPGGGWLLFSYLNYAEVLGRAYARRIDEDGTQSSESNADQAELAPQSETAMEQSGAAVPGVPTEPSVNATRSPSPFAASLALPLMRAAGAGATVHWGNEGFCVDIAMHHPQVPEDVTVGVLTDFARFDSAGHPIEWDIFRSRVLKATGWKLHRVWSPVVFRDLAGTLETLAESAAQEASKPRKDLDTDMPDHVPT